MISPLRSCYVYCSGYLLLSNKWTNNNICLLTDLQCGQGSEGTSHLCSTQPQLVAQRLSLESSQGLTAHLCSVCCFSQLSETVVRTPMHGLPYSCLASSEHGGWVLNILRELGRSCIDSYNLCLDIICSIPAMVTGLPRLKEGECITRLSKITL